MAKLDRFLVSHKWEDRFPNSNVNCLASDVSDHVPLMLTSDWDKKFVKMFKFERMWTLEPGFSDNITRWWQLPSLASNSTSNLVTKIRRIRGECKNWCKYNFYNVNKNKIDLLGTIRNIDRLEEVRDLSDLERSTKHKVKREY